MKKLKLKQSIKESLCEVVALAEYVIIVGALFILIGAI